jgi:hypothetical protein
LSYFNPKNGHHPFNGDNSQYHPNYATPAAGDGYAITTVLHSMFGVPFSHFGVGC